ncbi:MAG: hypothetical protein F6K65_27065 [Moorea sp. SIO3C2]|nr:hypothetical protein [Moorena sp. SIO3C2]
MIRRASPHFILRSQCWESPSRNAPPGQTKPENLGLLATLREQQSTLAFGHATRTTN